VLQTDHELARLVHRQLVAVPFGGGGEQLQRVVVLGRRGIALVDPHRRGGEGGLGVADLRVLEAGVGLHDLRDQPGAAEGGARRAPVVAHPQPVRGVARRLVGLGQDHRDDLAVVADVGGIQHGDRGRSAPGRCHLLQLAGGVAPGQDVDHAGQRAGLALVDLQDASERDGAGVEVRVQRRPDRRVGAVRHGAGDLASAVDARHPGADAAGDRRGIGIGEGCGQGHGHRQILMSRACSSARTRVRRASSGLKSL
jgi:hypothetical protein